jgi:hypothetical protein
MDGVPPGWSEESSKSSQDHLAHWLMEGEEE